METPYMSCCQDLQDISLLNRVLRKCGAFFHDKDGPELYDTIYKEYLMRLAMDGATIQVFLEEHRARSGKMGEFNPIVIDTLVKGIKEGRIEEVYIVPMTINYDRIFEGETFPFELLGEEKVQESLPRVIRAFYSIKRYFGKAFVKFCDPIALSSIVQEQTALSDPKEDVQNAIVTTTTALIRKNLSQNIIIMSSALVSTILLMQRKGISEDQLVKQVSWLYK